ncbi:MAG: phosphatidate cytidylyltransferase [Deltaproteobacteria bacterium]|nr:phosphatidate cytidylyltransferase [Deltaproteobacteria bacterium]
MHLKRWITGIIAIPILIYLIGFGPRWLFYVFLLFSSLAGLIEFYRLSLPEFPRTVRSIIYILVFSLFLIFYIKQILFVPVILILLVLAPMTYYVLIYSTTKPDNLADIGKALIGTVYIVLPLSLLILVDTMVPGGKFWVFFLLAVIFSNDTGAFYFGRTLGRHKLHESVSPNKTWEGAIGGLLCSFMAAVIFLKIFPVYKINPCLFILVLFLSVSSQIGDLVESMIKRYYGVKDSGNILPGHGGMLDRIDGLLFSIPVLYLFLLIVK